MSRRDARVNMFQSSSRDTGEEPLNASWDVGEEAKGFAHLYHTGRVTVYSAAQDILMSDEVLRFLISQDPLREIMLRAIQRRRQRTCETFLGLIGGSGGTRIQ